MARKKNISKPDAPEGAVPMLAPKGATSISFPDYDEILSEDGVAIIPEEHVETALHHGYELFPEDPEE